ncbi:MAG: DUF1648 domain-containing protein [Rikenellaceae bacterium]
MDLNSITPTTSFDKTCEAVGCIITISMWICATYYHNLLPDTIPIHYNMQGVVDGYGGKIYIFLYTSLATLLYAVMTLVPKKSLRYIKLFVTIIFAIVLAKTIVGSL